jgi:hypothetical protein
MIIASDSYDHEGGRLDVLGLGPTYLSYVAWAGKLKQHRRLGFFSGIMTNLELLYNANCAYFVGGLAWHTCSS